MELTTIALAVPAAWIAYKALTGKASPAAPAAKNITIHTDPRTITHDERAKIQAPMQLAHVIKQGATAPSGKPFNGAWDRKFVWAKGHAGAGTIKNLSIPWAYNWNVMISKNGKTDMADFFRPADADTARDYTEYRRRIEG